MPFSLSILGAIHTVIAIVALVFAFIAIAKDGLINPFSSLGKSYSVLTVLASLTSFGLSKAGGFNPGHAIAILILVLIAVAYSLGKNLTGHFYKLVIQVLSMSATVFLSLIPTANETLSRVPIDAPLANGPDSPIVQNVVKVLFILFVLGAVGQYFKLKKLAK